MMIDNNDNDWDDDLFCNVVDRPNCISVTSSHCLKPRQEAGFQPKYSKDSNRN